MRLIVRYCFLNARTASSWVRVRRASTEQKPHDSSRAALGWRKVEQLAGDCSEWGFGSPEGLDEVLMRSRIGPGPEGGT
jgi:hypothetical protein